jgi:putative pyruvate formate lyase activating enzyme
VCGETDELRLAVASIHFGEEPPLVGKGGSGTIFVSGCNLGCIFCQNSQISHYGLGRTVNSVTFARICLMLEEYGAENLNIVTGSHALPALVEGICTAKAMGCSLPIFWNSSGYETVEAVEFLAPFIDGFMPDLKTLDSPVAAALFHAPDYPSVAQQALLAMVRHSKIHYRGSILRSGVIVRHLVVPGFLDSTYRVIKWFAEHLRYKALFSLMTQYVPVHAGPQRQINEQEYKQVLRWLQECAIEGGFFQELVTDTAWLPDFNQANPFSSALSTPLWHWREGFLSY